MTTWADLRVGDVIAARNGGHWRVDAWETVTGTRWLAAGGGKTERLFTLSIIDGSRPSITATHSLSDPVDRVFGYDRSEERQALTALSAAFDIVMISEGEHVTTTEPRVRPPACKHPEHEHSNLKDGRIWCTACFTTVGDSTDPVADAGLAAGAGLGLPVGAAAGHPANIVGEAGPVTLSQPVDSVITPTPLPYTYCVDASGVEYMIPNEQVGQACDHGIHPKDARQFDGEALVGCGACGKVYPLVAPPAVAQLAAVMGSTVEEAGAHVAAVVDAFADPAPEAPPCPVCGASTEYHHPGDHAAEAAASGSAPAVVDAFADPVPHHEVKRDRWGRYVLPHPVTGVEQGWVRASTLARVLCDEFNLVEWKLRMTAKGIAMNPDLIAGAVAAHFDDKATLAGLVKKAMERAESSAGANLGTALHSFTHRLDRGEPMASLRAPAPLDADLVEYLATLKRHGLTIMPELIERIVVCPELGVAGTFDRIVQQVPGPSSSCPLTVLDLKTGKSVEYGWLEYAIQQAIYNHATHMWDQATQTYVPMPPPAVLDRDRALILHLPVGKAKGTLYAVNTYEGYEAAKVAEQARVYRNNGKGYGWMVAPVDAEQYLIHKVSKADGPELARLWEVHNPRGEWTEAVQAAAANALARLSVVVP